MKAFGENIEFFEGSDTAVDKFFGKFIINCFILLAMKNQNREIELLFVLFDIVDS